MTRVLFLALCLQLICSCECIGSTNDKSTANTGSYVEPINYYLIKDSVYIADIIGVRNLGTVNHGEILESSVIIKNGFDVPLLISRIEASCGCVNVEFSSEPIMPGKTIKLNVVYNSNNKQGTQFAHIDLNTNKGVYVVRVETFINK